MRARFLTADVFTSRPFRGNQLAVFPDASAIREDLFLPIAREFNYSETTFVFPPRDPAHTRRVRIFTPGGEVPFAGHPTLGTAHALAATGEVPLDGGATRIVLEEDVGPIPVTIRAENARPVFTQLSVAQLPTAVGPPLPSTERLAEILSLSRQDIVESTDASASRFAPACVSCGLPFLIVLVRDRDAVRRARVQVDVWARTLGGTPAEMIYVVARDAEHRGHDLRARMFAPGISVPEDPATGSAGAALAGYLAERDPRRDGTLAWVVEQGFEMGRPSILYLEADKRDDAITAVRVGGHSVLISEGTLTLPD